MSVWFTADLHIGHRKVSEIRGFGDPRDHDEAIFTAWTETVRAGDVVWVLGDIAVSNPTYALAELRALPGTKHLIAGNHDGCHPMHRDSHKKQRAYLKTFESVQAFARRRINSDEVLLSHFPYQADRGPSRFTQYRLRNEGLPLLHGHTHGAERLNGNEIHVGLDAWGLRPVELGQVARLLDERNAA